jgi:hypothetical protein
LLFLSGASAFGDAVWDGKPGRPQMFKRDRTIMLRSPDVGQGIEFSDKDRRLA